MSCARPKPDQRPSPVPFPARGRVRVGAGLGTEAGVFSKEITTARQLEATKGPFPLRGFAISCFRHPHTIHLTQRRPVQANDVPAAPQRAAGWHALRCVRPSTPAVTHWRQFPELPGVSFRHPPPSGRSCWDLNSRRMTPFSIFLQTQDTTDNRPGDDRQQTQTLADVGLGSVVCSPAGFETASQVPGSVKVRRLRAGLVGRRFGEPSPVHRAYFH